MNTQDTAYKEAPENARKEAKTALVRTGVIKGGV